MTPSTPTQHGEHAEHAEHGTLGPQPQMPSTDGAHDPGRGDGSDGRPESHHGQHDKHAGHDPEAFRRRFWLSLLLTIPIVATSHMVMEWFGYRLDAPGLDLVGPVLGSAVFAWGGWP